MTNRTNDIADLIQEKDSNIIATPVTVTKNNDTIMHGIAMKTERMTVCPTFYVDDIPENESDSEIADRLIDRFYSTPAYDAKTIVEMASEFSDDIYDNVYLRLVNFGLNQQMLRNIPIKNVLGDLALYLVLEIGEGAIKINNELTKCWGLNRPEVDELFEYALRNTKRKGCKFLPMDDYLQQANCETEPLNIEMYIMTYENSNPYGAVTAIACKDQLANFAEYTFRKDILMIPSSIHEWLLIPYSNDIRPEQIAEMIDEVNRTQLMPEEILSDHPYVYERRSNSIHPLSVFE